MTGGLPAAGLRDDRSADLPLWRQLPPDAVVGTLVIVAAAAIVAALLWIGSPAIPDAASVT